MSGRYDVYATHYYYGPRCETRRVTPQPVTLVQAQALVKMLDSAPYWLGHGEYCRSEYSIRPRKEKRSKQNRGKKS